MLQRGGEGERANTKEMASPPSRQLLTGVAEAYASVYEKQALADFWGLREFYAAVRSIGLRQGPLFGTPLRLSTISHCKHIVLCTCEAMQIAKERLLSLPFKQERFDHFVASWLQRFC